MDDTRGKPKTRSEIAHLIECEANAIKNIPLDNPFSKVVSHINETIETGGKVVVSGVGKAGDVGRKIVSTFNSTGITAVFLPPLDAMHGDFGVVRENDTYILISNSGKTREVVELVKHTEQSYPAINTICITSDAESPLAKASDHVLRTGNPQEICPLLLTPTSSVLAMLAIADIVTVLSMRARGFTVEEYHKRHHGGYLGKKSKTIKNKKGG